MFCTILSMASCKIMNKSNLQYECYTTPLLDRDSTSQFHFVEILDTSIHEILDSIIHIDSSYSIHQKKMKELGLKLRNHV